MSKLHYDHKFNKAIGLSIVLMAVGMFAGSFPLSCGLFLGFWTGYNFDKIYRAFQK